MSDEYQFTNQFFDEGRAHYSEGGQISDCPYNYLQVEQSDERKVQHEHYRQREWMAGFRFQHDLNLERKVSSF